MAVLLGAFFIGYLTLAGLDYGVALTGRGRADFARIAPFFLANEVWLVAGAGFLLAAYPQTESTLFAEHRLPIILGLLGAVVVTACYGMRLFTHGRGFDLAARLGALTAVVGWGATLGSLLGSAWLGALVALPLFALHGWAFLRRHWTVLGLTAAAVAASALAAGSRVTWHPADQATLDLILPLAWLALPLVTLIQAATWLLLTRPRPRETPA